MTAFAAVDLGASSGRVIRAEVVQVDGEPRIVLEEVARFSNGAVPDQNGVPDGAGTLRWDLTGLFGEIVQGLRAAARRGPLAGIGIDTWAVDYGLIGADGALLAEPVAYRDERTATVIENVHSAVGPEELYAIAGMQHLPFNTIYQLAAERDAGSLDGVARALLIPDLLAYLLTGNEVSELTNASTTALLDQRTRTWSVDLLRRLGLPAGLFPDVVEPGHVIGTLSGPVREATGLGDVPVIAVGSHDTASAVAGIPATGDDFAYVSCGTWSLVGVELTEPVLTEASRAANFTNELGVDGTVRYLRNVMGLWLLQESQRTWREAGDPDLEITTLLDAAARVPARRTLVDVDHPDFLPPGDMPARIAAHARAGGQPVPVGPAEVTRCILDSLAVAYRRAVRDATDLSGHPVRVLHIVGGGSRNALLCQAAADATGLPVVAGPDESTALGNVLVQARAVGAVTGDLAGLRAIAARGLHLTRYRPDPAERDAWALAEERVHGARADLV
ncbi:rhamnulokinase [Occultella glacieicola]|uniref:Rhamnulokinase n=1 Tax=Occultella glacieicola TaxID=2518684 RepID=A0ABY2E2Z8_9MICO|nr:rhamnulokinase family protein [Occultella glacieicola]TDE89207.1 rhamnulokinase [Occultella glacieicola]